MRRLLSIIVSLVTAISFAQQPVELPLWPDGAPNSSGLTGEEQETRPHFVTNVTHPTLTVYHPEKPNGMACSASDTGTSQCPFGIRYFNTI